MIPTTEPKPTPNQRGDGDFAPQTKLFAVTFTHSVQFGSAKDSLAIDKTSSNGCDSITPALMLPDGGWRAIEKGEHADGLGFKKNTHNLHTRARETMSIFVPFSMISCIQYRGE